MVTPKLGARQAPTQAQALLLDRHEPALRRVAHALATRNKIAPTCILFVLADPRGRIGAALQQAISIPRLGPVVLPSHASSLSAWIDKLTGLGPVLDCTGSRRGIPVIVIDRNDDQALLRIEP